MRLFIGSIAILCVLLGCSSAKKTTESDSDLKHEVTVHFDVQLRHCGGTPPPKDYVNGIKTIPYANKKFYIKSGLQNVAENDVITSFTTDENGDATISLAAGSYCIVIPEKTKEFNTFLDEQSKPKDQFTQAEPSECFEKWHQSCDGILEVKEAGTFEFTLKEHCGYGFNPCMRYTGPPRP